MATERDALRESVKKYQKWQRDIAEAARQAAEEKARATAAARE